MDDILSALGKELPMIRMIARAAIRTTPPKP